MGCFIVIDCKWDEGVGESMPYVHIDKPGGDTFPRLHEKRDDHDDDDSRLACMCKGSDRHGLQVAHTLGSFGVLAESMSDIAACLPDDSHVINEDVITSCYCKRKRRCENSGLWWWCHPLVQSVIAGIQYNCKTTADIAE